MKRDEFVETSHVAALRDAVLSAKQAGQGFPAIVMAHGEPGTGKTWAARKLYVETGGYYLRALEGMTQNAFLQDLCFEITKTRPFRSAHAKQAIIKKLEGEPAPIYVDEIDRLHVGRMEDLRDICDITGAPAVFIGELGLATRVAARERINDRIPEAFRISFGAINRKDILLYARKAADLTLSPEAVSVVFEATKGIFRRVHNAVLSLENASKAAGTFDVNAEMARAVLVKKGAAHA